MKINDQYLKEINTIQDYTDTYFYITIAANPIEYGVAINIKDINRQKKIINQCKRKHKIQIEAWNEEQRKINEKKGIRL